jgi:hypothetical protein
MTRMAAGLALLILLPLAGCSSPPRYVHQYQSTGRGNMLAADPAGARLAQSSSSLRSTSAETTFTDGR